jgi:1-acyl-sn-glycerol-3-phosphate acyltransferase
VPQRHVPASLMYKVCQVFCHVGMQVVFDLKVYGAEHVPAEGGVLLLSNHQSYLDPVCVAVRLRRPVSFLAKSELFEPWGFRWLIRQLNAYPVRQGAGDIGAMKETIAKLKEGHVLTVFPEGTRTPDGELQPLQNGLALVVRRAGVPIVPVAIEGSFKAWPREAKLFHPSPVRVKYGPPMYMDGLKPDEIVARVDRALHGLLEDLRRMDRAERAEAGVGGSIVAASH